jgi:hypothetical protein
LNSPSFISMLTSWAWSQLCERIGAESTVKNQLGRDRC